jgi:hypothetical protein
VRLLAPLSFPDGIIGPNGQAEARSTWELEARLGSKEGMPKAAVPLCSGGSVSGSVAIDIYFARLKCAWAFEFKLCSV